MKTKPINVNLWVLGTAQFGMAMSFNFIMVFLPFYVNDISHLSPSATLIWVGLIMGSTSIGAAIASPFWAKMTSRISPKFLFEKGLLCHVILVALMAFTTNIYLLFILRMLQGLFGGISTIGMIIIYSMSSEDELSQNMGFYQSAMTLGHLIGPPIGSTIAATLGYRAAFLFASSVLFCFMLFSMKKLKSPPLKKKTGGGKTPFREIFFGWAVVFTVTVQLVFLLPILPEILKSMNITGEKALFSAGLIVTAYGITTAIGPVILSRLVKIIGYLKSILLIAMSGTLLQVLLILGEDVWSFTAIRMLQAFFVSSVLPIVISVFASFRRSETIGFLNSSRFTGNALAPIMATLILSYSNIFMVYLFVAGITLISIIGFWISSKNLFDENLKRSV